VILYSICVGHCLLRCNASHIIVWSDYVYCRSTEGQG
jgi:hypothetical protein